MVPCTSWCSIDVVFLSHIQCSQDMLQIHYNTNQDKMNTKDEELYWWMLNVSPQNKLNESQPECNIEHLYTRDSFGSKEDSQQHPRELTNNTLETMCMCEREMGFSDCSTSHQVEPRGQEKAYEHRIQFDQLYETCWLFIWNFELFKVSVKPLYY